MITERILTTLVNGLLSIIGNLIATVFSTDAMPSYQFGVPTPLWFIVAFIIGNVAAVYPIVFTWWLWRQVKG